MEVTRRMRPDERLEINEGVCLALVGSRTGMNTRRPSDFAPFDRLRAAAVSGVTGPTYICFTAYAIAAAIFSRSSSLCRAETAVRMRSLPGGTAGAMDITVNTPLSSSACQKR